MREDLKKILDGFYEESKNVSDSTSYARLREKYLSREKGILTVQLKRIREISQEERPAFGKDVNLIKKNIEQELARMGEQLELSAYRQKVEKAHLDVTLPGYCLPRGTYHPVKIVEKELCRIFEKMGYSIAEGPEIERDFFNFGALNFPPDHPARDEQDTFFLGNGSHLLRTHTSPVQIRTMQKCSPPMKIIAPGKVFRKDTPDATHYPIFHQIEGLVVAENVSLTDLKGTLIHFARECFSPDSRVRLRPSFFPFLQWRRL